MPISETQLEQLAAAATEVRANAYCEFSTFAVGAALLAADGRVFRGVNVENSSYGLTICAERFAVGAAVAAGSREYAAIAVATDSGAPPCGACRQFLYEFAPGLEVILVNTQSGDPPRRVSLASLLPEAFRFKGPA